MKKNKKEELQPEEPVIEKAAEEPKDAEEASEPIVEEEPKKEKKGMPRFLGFLIFELITLIIALGAQFALLKWVMPMLDLGELVEWIIATGAGFVLYLVAGYLFNHLIVWKGKGKYTFWKFLLATVIGWALALALIHLGIFIDKMIVPADPFVYALTALSVNQLLAYEGQALITGIIILCGDIVLTLVYSFLIRAFFVFKDKKAKAAKEAEEAPEEVEEEKEETLLTHDTFRQIVREEMEKFFTSKKKFVRYSQAQSYIDEGIKEYDEKHPKKEEK